MRSIIRPSSSALALLLLASLLFSATTDPFSNITADQRGSLSGRINGYVEAYKARNWAVLYNFISAVGKGGANQKVFIAAMQISHSKNFAQYPDLQAFRPYRAKGNEDGYDIYGCGKAEREGRTYKGIAVVHGVFEHNDWFFTGWSFTEFPNAPCKTLSDPKWEPENEMGWNRSMQELANFKQQGAPPHADTPH